MRVANLDGRAVLLGGAGCLDVEKASEGRFPADPAAIYDDWPGFLEWARGVDLTAAEQAWSVEQLGAPSPRPRQVFAVGLNYVPHVDESGFRRPESPLVFTKFPSCITGPVTDLVLPSGNVDWEVELVAIVGVPSHRVPRDLAWAHLAGLTVGQDYSERVVQSAGSPPQFSIGKSFPGFGPTGPFLVTPDEFADPDDLELVCEIDGEVVQRDRTSQLILTVPDLVAWLSDKCRLFPGDLIFTGTPGGTGAGQDPPRYLRPGEQVTSRIEGIGELRNRCHAG
jgi:2-keto-4-pentenoate hydratase/2-oxohepta-3-ene-1,7-dioic acid hydratase in catechol pathway